MAETHDAAAVAEQVARLFMAHGLAAASARQLAGALVDADLAGVPSHGLMQLEVYLARLDGGSVSVASEAELVVDHGAIAVLDAHDMFGHLAADQAMGLAIARARVFGAGVVAVRRGFHFGMAGRYAAQAAAAGCIGIAMCNVRPLMAAPGGVARVVGNNPLAIGVPAADHPIVLDMAMSEAAFAKLRLAEAAGRPIPLGWAVDAAGDPTTNAAEAMAGMLLPFGGAKGFALAFMIDLLCGLVSGGGVGDGVAGMLQIDRPMNCSFLLVAIDVAHFRPLEDFRRAAAAAGDRLRGSARRPGVEEIRVPGDGPARRRAENAGRVVVPDAVLELLG